MQRPPSIVSFERLYLGSIVLGLVNTAIGWKAREDLLNANPAVAGNPQAQAMLAWMLPAATVVGLAISLLLWFLVARKASLVAKWIVTVFAGFGAIGAIGVLWTLVRGLSPSLLVSVVGLVTTGLSIAAAAMLFRPDARLWFGEEPDVAETVQ